MKKLVFIALSLNFLSLAGLAQRPIIGSVSPVSATVNSTITITGSNLPTGANAHVQFGAARGEVVESSGTQIKASVPAGVSYENLVVTNLSTALSAKSRNPFLLSFGGSSFDANKFTADAAYASNFGLFEMCSCDFNGDKKVDVITTHENRQTLSAFRNTSTPSVINFVKTDIVLNGLSRNVICGDLDGDGKPDLVVSGTEVNANRIYVLRNLSTVGGEIRFGTATPLSLSSQGAAVVAIHDLNNDGKPEIAVTNISANIVTIFKNTSLPGELKFDTQGQDITVNGTHSTHGLSVQDLDGDGLADLAVTPFYGNNVYILRNTSSGSTISFTAGATLSSSDGLINVLAADLNGDGKTDLAATDIFSSKLMVWLNNSSSGNMQFGTATQFMTGSYPWGIATGDVDGNGKTDLVVSHIDSRSLFVLHNTSSNGALQLNGQHINTSEYGRYANVVDYNGDGKPDLAYSGIDGNNLRIFRNTHCVVPRLSHTGSVTLCSGQSIVVQATQALEVTYKWTRNGTLLTNTASSLTIAEAGNYAVSIVSAIDGCSLTSEVLQVVAGSGTGGTIAMEPIAATCVGGSALLKATAVSGATYVWNGPNGFTATTTTATYTLNNVQVAAAGSYSVVIKSGECQFTPAAQSLSVHSNPEPQITASATAFCAGNPVNLHAQAGFASYQWKLNGANYSGAGATTASITTNTAGSYSVLVTNTAGCTGESAAVSVSQIQAPVAGFNAPATACLQQPIVFQNTSTSATGQTPAYLWSFGDGNTSTASSPTHTYTTTGSFTVSLTVSMQGCSNSMSKTISVVTSPVVELVADAGTTFCPGDSVLLRVEGDAVSALWSTGATTLALGAKNAGTYTVDIGTSAGCVIQKSIALTHLDQPDISISASATSIHLGESVQLVVGGGLQYQWQDHEDISDFYSGSVSIKPTKTSTYTVTGWGSNGCYAKAEVTIIVDNSLRINPPKIFVPATDVNWVIKDIELYPELSLTIVNSLGRSIFAAKPYTNNWAGIERGRVVEAGVYYYIFKDAAGKVLKTGSITLLR